jgi:glyoxylase-like metal-dependent hydrolase (beta-lactamase superfamily II)
MIAIGELQIDRVEEICGAFLGMDEFLDGVPREVLARDPAWRARHGVDSTGKLVTSVHSWIVRTKHHVILIDTCLGNDKDRGEGNAGHRLQLNWLNRLRAKGLRPEDVDFVMCTHLHTDHVGWNTRLIDGRWVPTFPNARYIFSRTEYEHWHPEIGASNFLDQGVAFLDSVLPCVEAGQADIVEEGYSIDDHLMLEGAPGHTPGTCIIRASSAGSVGLFVGDCMHSPIQVAYPDVNSVACEIPDQARDTRRRLLSECAEHGHMILPAHFPPPFAGHVNRAGEAFEYLPLTGDTDRRHM